MFAKVTGKKWSDKQEAAAERRCQKRENGQHWPKSQAIRRGKHRRGPIALALRKVTEDLNEST